MPNEIPNQAFAHRSVNCEAFGPGSDAAPTRNRTCLKSWGEKRVTVHSERDGVHSRPRHACECPSPSRRPCHGTRAERGRSTLKSTRNQRPILPGRRPPQAVLTGTPCWASSRCPSPRSHSSNDRPGNNAAENTCDRPQGTVSQVEAASGTSTGQLETSKDTEEHADKHAKPQ